MSTRINRPRGVLVAAILLIVAGAFNLVAGIITLVSTLPAEAADATSQQQALVGGAIALEVGTVVIGILNIILAIGILRGNRVARLLVTILQAITIFVGVIGLSSSEASHDITRYAFTSIVTPLAIILMLWIGAETKAFFVRRD